jgi:molybdopterin molybdotransferase
LGISEVSVYAPPTVKLILTGNELATVGETLEYGQVYESNSFAISAVLSKWGARLVSTEKVKDDYELTRQKISDSLDVDILLITGGVSVGDYDFVTDALSEVGVQKIFHKIRQRPGKPLFFGRKSSTLVFGLPGNPASVLTCVYEYLSLAIGKLMHQNFYHTTTATLKHPYKKKAQLTHFFKGLEINGEVEILSNQESYLMNSFAAANCLVHLDEYTETFEVGQKLTITRLS